MKSIKEMSKRDFYNLPLANFDMRNSKWFVKGKEISSINSVVLLPAKNKHDSGYRCIQLVACSGDRPICRMGYHSDVIHIEGIGGYGDREKGITPIPVMVKPSGWNVDCLPKSNLMRLFCSDRVIKAGNPLSSLEIFSVKKEC